MAQAPRIGSKKICLVSPDGGLKTRLQQETKNHGNVELGCVEKPISEINIDFDWSKFNAIIVDLQSCALAELESLQALVAEVNGTTPILVVVDKFDAGTVRVLMQMKISDFVLKTDESINIISASISAVTTSANANAGTEAEIYTFMPASGGVGTTTLALQTGFLLNEQAAASGKTTCVVDLNLQHGQCAEYLDIEPRFDAYAIDSSPERLDRQLLEVMLSSHSSGLSLVGAPSNPTDMQSFKPEVVVQLLDLVASNFDNIVIDMPRFWFPWTDAVIQGSSKLYVVSDMTLPCIRQTQRLVSAIVERQGVEQTPQVVINRFESNSNFSGGLKNSDFERAFGEHYCGGIANNYRLVREAVERALPIDEVKPGSNVINDLRKIIFSRPVEVVEEKQPESMLARGRHFFKRKSA